MNHIIKGSWPYIVAVLAIIVINIVVFFPQLQGEQVSQVDIQQGKARTKTVKEYEAANDKAYYWNPAVFSGMPRLANPPSDGNLIIKTYQILKLGFDEPLGLYIAGTLLCFIMFLSLGFNVWYSLLFSIPMILATDNLILWEAGHNSKIRTLIFTPLILAGVLNIFEKKRYYLGFILLAFGFAFSTATRHPQMTYYILMVLMVYGFVILYQTIKSKTWRHFAMGTGLVLLAGLLGMGTSTTKLWSMYEYSDATMRGKTILQSDSGQAQAGAKGDGLDWEYAMQWSNSPKDLVATFIPGFVGGGSGEKVSTKSESYKALRIERAPLYWGNLPITSGPIYLGASVWFLFILGLFTVKGNIKWWLGLGALWMLLLSMGDQFSILNKPLFDYLPLYSKFRAPQSVLNIASFFLPILGAYGLHEFLKRPKVKKKKKAKLNNALVKRKQLLYASGICLILPVFFGLMGGSIFGFEAPTDARYAQQNIDVTPFIQDRKALLTGDSWRTALIIAALSGLLFAYYKEKLGEKLVLLGVGLILILDLFGINSRYLGYDRFEPARAVENEFTERPVDTQILSIEKDRSQYRVHDVTLRNPWSASSTSAFHNTIGGYSAIKMQRTNDLISRHLMRNNMSVMNMLNTKYFITPGENREPRVQQNPNAAGVAWYVRDVQLVNTPNEEIDALNNLDVQNRAVLLSSEFPGYTDGLVTHNDSLAAVILAEYEPDALTYRVSSSQEGLVVFSEIWYGPGKGWQAFLDNNPVDHVRVNYVLRGLRVPAGDHEVRFEFNPTSVRQGEVVSYASSAILIFMLLGLIFTEVRPRLTSNKEEA